MAASDIRRERGTLQALYIVTCGHCDQEPLRIEHASNRSAAVTYLRSHGWTNRRAAGWVCPDCDQPAAERLAAGEADEEV